METNNKVAGIESAHDISNNNNNYTASKEEEWRLMDKPFFNFDEIEQEFKNKHTKIHVVLKTIKNRIAIDKRDIPFNSEDEADMYAHSLALNLSGLPLDFWNISSTEIAVHYSLADTDDPNITYRITIYPKTLK